VNAIEAIASLLPFRKGGYNLIQLLFAKSNKHKNKSGGSVLIIFNL
jgi:hypothetical protein